MAPETIAPNASGSMEDERILSNAATFETFATHYANVLQKHKKKIRNHVINNPQRRSLRLIEQKIKQEQDCEPVISEMEPHELIPVMPLSALKNKRKCELRALGEYSPAPIKMRRRANVSLGRRSDSVETLPAVKCEPMAAINSWFEDRKSSPRSIIQIKQDFMKNSAKSGKSDDERSINFLTQSLMQRHNYGLDCHSGWASTDNLDEGRAGLKDEQSDSQIPSEEVGVPESTAGFGGHSPELKADQIPPLGPDVQPSLADLTEIDIGFAQEVIVHSDWNNLNPSPKLDPRKMYPCFQPIDDDSTSDDEVKSLGRSSIDQKSAPNGGWINERFLDAAYRQEGAPNESSIDESSQDADYRHERSTVHERFQDAAYRQERSTVHERFQDAAYREEGAPNEGSRDERSQDAEYRQEGAPNESSIDERSQDAEYRQERSTVLERVQDAAYRQEGAPNESSRDERSQDAPHHDEGALNEGTIDERSPDARYHHESAPNEGLIDETAQDARYRHEGAANENSIDERSQNAALNYGQSGYEANNAECSGRKLSDVVVEISSDNATSSDGSSFNDEQSVSSQHEDSGMASTDSSDTMQDDDSSDDVCFVPNDNDAGAYRSQEARQNVETIIHPNPDDNFHVSPEQMPPQDCPYDTPAQSEEYNCKPRRLVCPLMPYDSVEGSDPHPDHLNLNSPVSELGREEEHAPCPEEEPNAVEDIEPVQIRIEQISDADDNSERDFNELDDYNEEQPQENYYNQHYAYPFAEENPAPGMQFNGLDPQYQQYQRMYHLSGAAEMPGQPAAGYTHMPGNIFAPMFGMNPNFNCWVDAQIYASENDDQTFKRRAALFIKYAGNTTVLMGELFFCSEQEIELFRSYFQPPQSNNQYQQPQQFFYSHNQAQDPAFQPESDYAPEAEWETSDQQERYAEAFHEDRYRSNQFPCYNRPGVEIMEIESSDEEDNDQAAVAGPSSNVRPSQRTEHLLRVQPSIRRKKSRRLVFSANLKRYLIHTQTQEMRPIRTVISSASSQSTIRLRADLTECAPRFENPERGLWVRNREFRYMVRVGEDCRYLYVAHNAVNYLYLGKKFHVSYVRFILGLSRIDDYLQLTEIED